MDPPTTKTVLSGREDGRKISLLGKRQIRCLYLLLLWCETSKFSVFKHFLDHIIVFPPPLSWIYWIKRRVIASEVPADTPLFPRSKSTVCGRTNLLKSLLRLFRRMWDEFWHLLICVRPLHTLRFAYERMVPGRTWRLSASKPTQASGSSCLVRLFPRTLWERYQAQVATCFSTAGCSWFPKTLARTEAVLFHPFQDLIFKEWELVRTTHAKSIPTTR